MRCKLPDGTYRTTEWLFIKNAWLSVISVCNQRIFSYSEPVVDSGEPTTVEIIDLTVDSEYCNITPVANRTIGRFNTSLSGNVNLIVDKTNSKIGDELILIYLIDSSVNIIMPNDSFVWNNNDTSVNATFSKSTNGNIDRWALVFTFDGEKFVSTYEHC